MILKQEQEYDENFAYLIWYAEKEFNVGPIGPDFPVLKLFNLVEGSNLKKYNNAINKSTKKGAKTVK